MSIHIDAGKCAGCGNCADICPGGLIELNESRKAEIAVPEDCWGCTACLKECGYGAISYFLGADIGGKGMTMTVRSHGETLEWIFRGSEGWEKTIVVDRDESNR
ncbi:MAG: ferredoxin family protein [Synergistaceae bacterium]|jgi:adenylylsulfate reductase subunit B|nr:ferredoxin family protein [Synergistaceae bacterium]